jgi:hypothetical protein
MQLIRIAPWAFLSLAGCSTSSGGEAVRAPTAAAKPEPVVPPNAGEWGTWSHDHKLAYMKAEVIEREKAIFASFDPVRFAKLTCKTCHGTGAVDGTFKMPNPDLPKWPGGMDAFRALKEKDPRMLEFMQKVVVPQTAQLLNVQAFDFATHTGFSCFQCHVRGEWNGIPPVSPPPAH